MSFPVSFVLAVTGLIVSAHARLNAVLFGQPVSVPVLWLLSAALLLGVAALVLHLARVLIQDRPPRESRPASRPVYVITSAR